MNLAEALGAEIRAEAAAQRITLVDLAKKAGIARATLYNWIDAERDISVPGLFSIADVLRTPASTLIARAEHRANRIPDGDA